MALLETVDNGTEVAAVSVTDMLLVLVLFSLVVVERCEAAATVVLDNDDPVLELELDSLVWIDDGDVDAVTTVVLLCVVPVLEV